MRHKCQRILGQIDHGARYVHLACHVNKELVSNFVLHKKKGGRLPGPASYQATMSVIAANDSGCRTLISTVCMARMSTEPAV